MIKLLGDQNDGGASLLVKQQKKERYFWMFAAVVSITSSLVYESFFVSLITGIPVLFMLQKSFTWEDGFLSGLYGDESRIEETSSSEQIHHNMSYAMQLEIANSSQKWLYLIVVACIGVLILTNDVDSGAARVSGLIAYFFVFAATWYLGESVGRKTGLTNGFNMRSPNKTEPDVDTSEYILVRATEKGREAKAAMVGNKNVEAWKLLQQQKSYYNKLLAKGTAGKIDYTALDSRVSKDLGNLLRLEKKHTDAFTHIIYWVANSKSITKDQESKLRAYFNRAKLKGATVEDVMEYCLADGVKELRAIKVDVNSWK